MWKILVLAWSVIVRFITEEWFWAMITIVITLCVFVAETHSQNKISRANFVYNISNDFGNNERILRVYQWLEKCRRQNSAVDNYRQLHISTDTGIYDEDKKETAIDFIDIDTYINHFEVVYVILNSVNIRNIDQLFQQRFLCFMFNPYIQKEELFACFLPDENDFLLQKKWLRSLYQRNRFTPEAFVRYLNTFTCGDYEFSLERLALTKDLWPRTYAQKVKDYLMNYVLHICNPACRYGFFAFRNRAGDEKVLRIIRSQQNDKADILSLQQRIVSSMENPHWFFSSSEAEIQTALDNPKDNACVQICDGSKVVAFGFVILNPTTQQDINADLKAHGLPYADTNQCILDTVFVDPAYRGFGLQDTIIRVLCSWAATLGKRNMAATIHPENHFSADNFQKNGFEKITSEPIPKYDGLRNVFSKDLSEKDTQKELDGTYTIYPYV